MMSFLADDLLTPALTLLGIAAIAGCWVILHALKRWRYIHGETRARRELRALGKSYEQR